MSSGRSFQNRCFRCHELRALGAAQGGVDGRGLPRVALYAAVDRVSLIPILYGPAALNTDQALRKRVSRENRMARNGSVRPMASTAIISAPSSL